MTIGEVYKKFKKKTNMTCSEMKKWSNNPCSNKASLDRSPIKRNIRLLCKRKSDWTDKDVSDAKKTISFISRMEKVNPGKPVSKNCPRSKRDYSLKNWAKDFK